MLDRAGERSRVSSGWHSTKVGFDIDTGVSIRADTRAIKDLKELSLSHRQVNMSLTLGQSAGTAVVKADTVWWRVVVMRIDHRGLPPRLGGH